MPYMSVTTTLKKLRVLFIALLVLGLGMGFYWPATPEPSESATTHELTFVVPDHNYKSVKIIGDFTNWQTVDLAAHNAGWEGTFTSTPTEHAFGLYVDEQWRIVSGVRVNNTIISCQNDKSQYTFRLSDQRAVINACDNIPRATEVTLIYKNFAAQQPSTVHFLTSLNDWQELPTTRTTDGLYYVILPTAHFSPDAPAELGAVIDGQWYNGDHLFANQVALTCTDQKGLLSFAVDGNGHVSNACDNVPHRANLSITYIAKSLSAQESVQLLGSFNAWTATAATPIAGEAGRYTSEAFDVPVGTQHMGLLVNGQWQANPGVVLINGSLVTKVTSSNQLEFCLAASGAVQNGSCPQ